MMTWARWLGGAPPAAMAPNGVMSGSAVGRERWRIAGKSTLATWGNHRQLVASLIGPCKYVCGATAARIASHISITIVTYTRLSKGAGAIAFAPRLHHSPGLTPGGCCAHSLCALCWTASRPQTPPCWVDTRAAPPDTLPPPWLHVHTAHSSMPPCVTDTGRPPTRARRVLGARQLSLRLPMSKWA